MATEPEDGGSLSPVTVQESQLLELLQKQERRGIRAPQSLGFNPHEPKKAARGLLSLLALSFPEYFLKINLARSRELRLLNILSFDLIERNKHLSGLSQLGP